MTQYLRSFLLPLALATGVAAVTAVWSPTLVQRAQAQPTAPAAPSGSCDTNVPGASGPSGCKSGVIRPPATGDKGVVAPPDTSQSMPMPVIPPPGSPGGNQSVQPK